MGRRRAIFVLGCLHLATSATTTAANVQAVLEAHSVVDVQAVVANTSAWSKDGRRLTASSRCDLTLFQNYLTTFGKDIFVNASLCEASINHLQLRLAGGFGPVLQSDMEIVMCSSACVSSDLMHLAAMEASHCTCTELSSDSYITQDFCRQNSARLLCSILGVCGTWGCGLHDFMCPRYEWDRHYPCGGANLQPPIVLLLGIVLFHVWRMY
ncbi:hypothetical protein ACHHYP_07079 [Achlya hypogyna]|uniref:Secreted protein n=1 Tax=Achlya hypogyna TaxID=1202772 RepID=A0A1V9ZMP4_ACHHY|nr:hypothetical protein ACHHYP_07079 [Achlya hypogyna]